MIVECHIKFIFIVIISTFRYFPLFSGVSFVDEYMYLFDMHVSNGNSFIGTQVFVVMPVGIKT